MGKHLQLPSIKELLKTYRILPKKRFSQNFLTSQSFCDAFTKSIEGPFSDTLFVDVGVGPGGISRSLLKKGAQSVIGLEKDEAFKPILEQLRDSSNSNFDFIIGDASDEHDVRLLCKAKCLNKSRVVLLGNLPFSIGGTLLSLWTRQSFLDNGLFETRNVEMTLMFTNAVAKRLLYLDCKRTKFAVITNIAFEVSFDKLFPKSLFSPMPVEDCISLKFIRRDAIFNSEKEVNSFYEFMDAVYSTPNRNASTAFKNIKGYQDLFKATNVDPRMKIHEISSKQILEMFKLYYSG